MVKIEKKCLEADEEDILPLKFIGVQQLEVIA